MGLSPSLIKAWAQISRKRSAKHVRLSSEVKS